MVADLVQACKNWYNSRSTQVIREMKTVSLKFCGRTVQPYMDFEKQPFEDEILLTKSIYATLALIYQAEKLRDIR